MTERDRQLQTEIDETLKKARQILQQAEAVLQHVKEAQSKIGIPLRTRQQP